MPNYNEVLLMGNLTRDPEVKYTPKGTAVCQLGLAINRKWTNEAGEQKEEVTFIDCEAWGRTAETIGQYLTKGKPIFIRGRLKTDSWEDKESGEKRSKLKVVVESFQFIGGKSDGDDTRQEAPSTDKEAAQVPARAKAGAPAGGSGGEDDSNIPFNHRFTSQRRGHNHHAMRQGNGKVW